MIYFDSAATTLRKPETVYRETLRAMRTLASPGRGQYNASEKASEVLYNCREKAAKLFNVSESDNVVFTFNATHGLNIAINTLAFKGCKAVVSGYEHNAVMRPLRHRDADITVIRTPLFDTKAAIDGFDKAINRDTNLVVCTAMSNVFGFILPIYEIAEICKDRNVPLIIDASQGAGVLDLDFQKLGAAFMAMPGHKGLYGPQGTGILLCAQPVKSLIFGGTGGNSVLLGMPDFLPDAAEAGTHNVLGIAGLSAGIDYVLKTTAQKILKHERTLAKLCAEGLKQRGYSVFSSSNTDDFGGVLSFVPKFTDPITFAASLAAKGVCVRAGLHCAPTAHETANTLSSGTVRISVSSFNSIGEIDDFLRITNQINRI